MNKEFKKLHKKGEKMREEINDNLLKHDFKKDKLRSVWKQINELVNNEILEERECSL